MSLAMHPSTPEPAYLSALNPEQKEAVLATQGPLLVLAGAGTGKTRVLTARIAHILARRLAFPSQILAVTFTNKAAREMAARVGNLIAPQQVNPSLRGVNISSPWKGEDQGGGPLPNPDPHPNLPPYRGKEFASSAPMPFLGTFHSIAAKILRRYAESVGLTPHFTILDTDDQLRLLKAILKDKNIDEQKNPPKQFLGLISAWKDQGLTPDKLGPSHTQDRRFIDIYKTYQERLRTVNACDFGDLLLHNLTLFANHPEVLDEYAQRFKYILVDEYQDTNIAQYLWLRLLAMHQKSWHAQESTELSGGPNICCVGDDDQSIYGWRGAEVGNILRFEQDFPGAKTVRLERNYRSTGNILGAASHLIANNKTRLGKTLWTEGESGGPVRLNAMWDDAEEARFIGDEIEMLQHRGFKLSEMAVLVRAGFQTRAFEERFLTLGLNYRVVGGLRFYERLEIRDAVAYLRVVFSPQDDLAFERIINTPKRGIGKATLEQIHARARAAHCSLYAATGNLLLEGVLKGKVGAALAHFLKLFEQLRAAAKLLSLPELTEKMLDDSGYRAAWMAEKSPEAAGRVENLKELVRAMGDFEDLSAFLEHVGLVAERAEEKDGDMISLMTLHAAKGLEFRAVFLPGWEEGLFPHQRSLDEGEKGLEEERRLAYVGITRAREHLLITFAANRRIYNQWQSSLPSRFIDELPPDHIDTVDPALHRRGNTPLPLGEVEEPKANRVRASLSLRSPHPNPLPKGEGTPASRLAPRASYYIGDRVFHMKFGYGRVMDINANHLDIAFEKAGDKKVLAEYVKKA